MRTLALSVLVSIFGAGNALAANALVVGFFSANISPILTAAGYTVTNTSTVPADLSPYAQVWDTRYNVALVPADNLSYTTYLAAGGTLLLIAETSGSVLRNNSVLSLVSSLGGGTLGPLVNVGFVSQTVQAPFTGPSSISAITWQAASLTPTAANGSFITTTSGGGSAVAFAAGTLSGAAYAKLIVLFDLDFIYGSSADELAIKTNMVAFLVPGPPPPPPPTPSPTPSPTAFPPTITSIANVAMGVNGSTTVGFSVTGAVAAGALQVRASASNPTLLPTLTLARVNQDGLWTLRVPAADGRAGAAVVTVTVSDGTRDASTSFTVTIATTLPGSPSAPVPTNLVASASGSGIALTWSAPTSDLPNHYVVSVATTPGGASIAVFVTPDAATSYVVPMVPAGTYYFRVQAVADSLGVPSNEAIVVATGSTSVMGVPTGVMSTVNGSTITVTWTAPGGGLGPPLYLVEFGTAPGRADLAVVTAVNGTYTRDVDDGLYFMRVRSFNGGAPSAPSGESSITVGPGACSVAPFIPVLLPVLDTDGVVSFSWLPPASWTPGGGMAPERYRIDLTAPSGMVTAVTTAGAGSSATWSGPAGSYRARVTAGNQCGTSTPSNEVSFVHP